jgi:hypothetical protein
MALNGIAHFFINVSNCLNTNIYSYLETNGGQRLNFYMNVVHFYFKAVLIRHLWPLKTVVFLNWCQIRTLLLRIFSEKNHLYNV